MFDKFKQIMDMKKQADQIKKELEATSVDVTDVKGITISVNGAQKFQSFSIDENIINLQDKSKLEAEILRSINHAIGKSQALAASKMKHLMPGM